MMEPDDKLRFIVRQAADGDWEACVALDHSSSSDYVWQVEARDEPGHIAYHFRTVRLPRMMAIPYPRDVKARRLAWQQHDYRAVAAAPDGHLYGYLTLRLDPAYQMAWISDLVVDKRWRRRRIGTALLLETRQWVLAQAVRRLTIETQSKNFPAIAFCQRHGMTFCGFNDRYYLNRDIALFFSQNVR